MHARIELKWIKHHIVELRPLVQLPVPYPRQVGGYLPMHGVSSSRVLLHVVKDTEVCLLQHVSKLPQQGDRRGAGGKCIETVSHSTTLAAQAGRSVKLGEVFKDL